MPLIRKAKKPAWQRGVVAPNKPLRQAQAIVADNETRFSRAFNRLLNSLVTPEMLRLIERAIKEETSPIAIMERLPFFDETRPETFPMWERFAKSMESTFQAVVNDAIETENRNRGWNIAVVKADDIPINPSVLEFIRLKSLTRVVDISEKEAARIRFILETGLGEGATATSMVDEIADTVGLTEKQVIRLNVKLAKASEGGMGVKILKQLRKSEASKTRMQRARAIARTETNEALSFGLQESWKTASSEGLMPLGATKQWAAMPFSPGRSSEVCQDLNGQEVGIDEDFHSDVDGGFDGPGPPAHPN